MRTAACVTASASTQSGKPWTLRQGLIQRETPYSTTLLLQIATVKSRVDPDSLLQLVNILMESQYPRILRTSLRAAPNIVQVLDSSIRPLRAIVPWLDDYSGDRDAAGFLKHDKPWPEALQCLKHAQQSAWVVNGSLVPDDARCMAISLWENVMVMPYYPYGARLQG